MSEERGGWPSSVCRAVRRTFRRNVGSGDPGRAGEELWSSDRVVPVLAVNLTRDGSSHSGSLYVRVAWALLALSIAAIVVRQSVASRRQLRLLERDAARKGSVLMPGEGDVPARDVPKVREFLRGRLFSDPHYKGEGHWYPFIQPLVVASICRLTGCSISHGYFLAAIVMVLAFLLAAGLAVARFGGICCLWVIPVAVWSGWLTPGPAMYPYESARFAICVYFMLAATVLRDASRAKPLRTQLTIVLGGWTGLLALWNGASFFACLPVSCVVGVRSLMVEFRAGRGARAAKQWMAGGATSLLVFSWLVAPQLIHYGHIAQADSARLFLQPFYEGGRSLARALSFPIRPRGLEAWLVLAFIVVLFSSPLSRGTRFRQIGVPVAIAYGTCMVLALAGYGLNDPAHPIIAGFIRRHIPAPPPTFYIVARWGFYFLVLSGGVVAFLAGADAIARAGVRRYGGLAAKMYLARQRLGLGVSALAFVLLVPTFPAGAEFYTRTEDRDFVAFANEAQRRVGDHVLFARDPLRLIAAAPVRVMFLDEPDHTNYYVYNARKDAVRDVDHAVAAGDYRKADRVLEQYDVQFFLAGPASSKDALISHCADPAVLEYRALRLHPRRSCR